MGYLESGTASRTCEADKMWSGSDFTCTACTGNTYGNGCSQMCTCITDAQCNHVNGACTCIEQFVDMICDTSDISVTLAQQGTYLVTSASDLALQCNVNLPSQDVQMKWTFDGTDLVNPAVPEDGIVNLTRTNLDPERDSGVYACVAASGQGVNAMTVTASVTVDVQVPAVITEIPVGVNLTLSEDAEFRCSGHGKRIPTLTWHSGYAGQLMDSGSKIQITYDEQGYTLSSVLRIYSVVRSDGGSYSCQADNGYGVVEEDFNLVVLEVPDPVTITQFKAVTAERIDLGWTLTFDGNLVINSCSVEYMYRQSNEAWTQWIFYETVDGGGSMFMVQIEGLTPFTEYKARVKCRNELGYSEFTESPTVKTPISSPDPPTDVTIAAKSDSELLVLWVAPKVVHGILQSYKVYYKLQGERDYGEPNETIGTETFLTIDGLEAFTTYDVQVTAINTNQHESDLLESSYSIMERARTLEGVPENVIIVIFVNKSSTELEVRWKPSLIPRGVTNRYELRLLNSVIGQQIHHHNFTNLESPEDEFTDYKYDFTDLSPHTEYIVMINICNRLHCSEDATDSATTSHGKPSRPRQVSLCNGSDSLSLNCNVCWQEPENPNGIITHYIIEYTSHDRTEDGFDPAVKETGFWMANSYSRNHSESKNTWPSNSEYQISVRAATYAEESDSSSEKISCRTKRAAPPRVTVAPSHVTAMKSKEISSLWVRMNNFSEVNGPISCYEVIVIQIPENTITGSAVFDSSLDPDEEFPPSQVRLYEEAVGNPGIGYVAIRIPGKLFEREVQIGDGKESSCNGQRHGQNKRGADQNTYSGKVYNGELLPDTWYSAFIRAFVDDLDQEQMVYYSSSPFMEPFKTSKDGNSAVTIAVVIIVIVIVAAGVVGSILLIRRSRRRTLAKETEKEENDPYTELSDVRSQSLYTGLTKKEPSVAEGAFSGHDVQENESEKPTSDEKMYDTIET
ncbi:cell adhesion molecule DSCAM-like [Ptychodera flava]|uniref:cell adhesion molecule DSCAM-like n=1 Tax=Ptychodera flava TaxID=63121 RepID=UPI00396A6156